MAILFAVSLLSLLETETEDWVRIGMLPQHYQTRRYKEEDDHDDDDDDDKPSFFSSTSTRPRGAAGAAPSSPPLAVTGVLCETQSIKIPAVTEQSSSSSSSSSSSIKGTLQYTVFRPRYVHMKPPLVVVAGGPYLPWNYLSVLVHLVNDRSLIFFDPIGCGQSKRATSSSHHDDYSNNNNNQSSKEGGEEEESTTTQHETAATKSASERKTPPVTIHDNSSVENNSTPTTTTTTTPATTKSSNPTPTTSSTSTIIPDMVHDLLYLIQQHLKLSHYHLLGHSFGGIVAYEALVHAAREKVVSSESSSPKDNGNCKEKNSIADCCCLSLILSSTPADLPQALRDIDAMKASLATEIQEQQQSSSSSSLSCHSHYDNLDEAVAHEFAMRHECRVRPLPLPLQQSLTMAGFASSPSSTGWQAVADYKVDHQRIPQLSPSSDVFAPSSYSQPDKDDAGNAPVQQPPLQLDMPLLLLRGEYDFISEAVMEPWTRCVVDTASKKTSSDDNGKTSHNSSDTHQKNQIFTLPGVAHYGMLEDETAYGNVVRQFLSSVSEPALKVPGLHLPNNNIKKKASSSSSSNRRKRLPR